MKQALLMLVMVCSTSCTTVRQVVVRPLPPNASCAEVASFDLEHCTYYALTEAGGDWPWSQRAVVQGEALHACHAMHVAKTATCSVQAKAP